MYNMNMDISKERLANWKKTFAKTGITYETDDEYKEAILNLVGYFEILIEMDRTQKERAVQAKQRKSKGTAHNKK